MIKSEEIISDLRNGKTIQEVCQEKEVTLKQLFSIIRKKQTKTMPKYISRSGKRYRVIRHMKNKKCKTYGSFDTLEEAIEMRNRLINTNWELPPKEYMGMMYIQKDKNSWKIQKQLNGKQRCVARFKTMEDAINVRDMLVKFEWDLDYLELICRQLGVERNGS